MKEKIKLFSVMAIAAVCVLVMSGCIILPAPTSPSEPAPATAAPVEPAAPPAPKGEVHNVTVRPLQVTVLRGMTYKFAADIVTTGDVSKELVWEISGYTAPGTNISPQGVITIGNGERAEVIVVKVSSKADPTKFATAKVII